MNTSGNARPASLPRLVRLVVVIFLPWIALYKSRRQLWMAGLVIRNTARGRFPEDKTMLRWADEIEHDGWLIWKPYNKDADGQPNAGTQRPGSPDGSLATETRKPGSLK